MSLETEQVEKIVALHRQGLFIHEIAKEFDVAPVTMRRWIKKIRQTYDLPHRKKSRTRRIDHREICAEETPWNIHLSKCFLTREWRT